MKKTCQACGVEEEADVKKYYPPTDELIGGMFFPLMPLDCQGDPIPNDPNGYSDFRRVLVCHSCFHKLSPDMWISRECWETLKPVVPFEQLERI